jgi:hypothetical protein
MAILMDPTDPTLFADFPDIHYYSISSLGGGAGTNHMNKYECNLGNNCMSYVK